MGQTIHHERVTANHDPVRALARRFQHILQKGGTDKSLLCDYKENPSNISWHCVTSQGMITVIGMTARALGLHRQGIDPDLIRNHSLQAGGAMALAPQGIKTEIIMKHSRWTSLTFMIYSQSDCSPLQRAFSKNDQSYSLCKHRKLLTCTLSQGPSLLMPVLATPWRPPLPAVQHSVAERTRSPMLATLQLLSWACLSYKKVWVSQGRQSYSQLIRLLTSSGCLT